MKCTLKIMLVLTVLMASMVEADAQINRRKVRKNAKRMANFKGSKGSFSKNKQYLSIGFAINAINYFGDIAPTEKKISTDFSLTRPGIGFSAAYRFGPRFSARSTFSWGRLKGDDFESADPNDDRAHSRYIRNIQFRNDIKELSNVVLVDLFKNEGSYLNRVEFSPYVFGGLAVFHHNPKGLVPESFNGPEAGTWVPLQPLGTEGQHSVLDETDVNFGIKPYKRIQLAIPVGIGMRARLGQALDVSFEMGFRQTLFDYLDDVSANYVDLDVLGSDLARVMSDRSLEAVATVSGQDRFNVGGEPNLADEKFNAGPVPYTGRSGGSYMALPGYGKEHVQNIRGSKDDWDIYTVTSIKIAYIVGGSFRKAKFR